MEGSDGRMSADAVQCDDKALLSAIRSCSACDGLPLGPRPILQWKRSAPVLIAGQAPGSRTHHKGVPFDDASGDRLRQWLGVGRETFYDSSLFAIVPMAFCFPGSGERGDLPPPPRCAELWRSRLLDRMSGVELTIILGRHAADWHGFDRRTTLAGLTGQWRETLPSTIVLPHPSPRNRLWFSRNPWFEAEVVPALRERISALCSTC